MLVRHSADRARPLVAGLAEVLSVTPSDPLAGEWLATPSDGMRRWLLLQLAAVLGSSATGRSDGVSANIELAFPGTLRGAVLAAGGLDWRTDPWTPKRLAWTVLDVLSRDAVVAEVGVPIVPEASRYAVVRQIADLFDRYHVHRPAMVRAWAAGDEVDGFGAALPTDAAWQARLWRRVRERIGQPSAPERWPALLDGLREGRLELDLPGRLLFFGFSLLPTGDFLELLAAVATQRDVHLFQLQPAAYDGTELAAAMADPAGGDGTSLRPRGVDDWAARHPLLRSWGRAQRESVALLAEARRSALFEDAAVPPGAAPAALTLLGRLQEDLRANRAPEPTLCPAPNDRSIQFHSCFGPARQVAALGDAIRHLLLDDPTLREEDVVVLCPALDRFAPLVEAVLGPSAPAAGSDSAEDAPDTPSSATAPTLRYRIVDQSVRNANEALEAALALLDLVSGRFEAPAVVDFLTRPPVRAAFGFDETDLADIDRWVIGTRVRWGLDPAHRSRFGLTPTVVSNTWQAAFDRLFVGSAVDTEGLALSTGDVVPFPVESGSVGCLGRLAEAVAVLGDLARATSGARTLTEWVALVGAAVRRVIATPAEGHWQLETVERSLAEVLDAAGDAGTEVRLEWADVRRVLGEYLGARRGRNDFFRGGITITSLGPLRDIPFRVVCLLGMDQWTLSGSSPSGDDLVQSSPALGDRDARSDLRQALLAAVLAAEERIVVLRDGHNPRTNQRIPRAVAVDELYEAVLAAVHPDHRGEAARRLEVDHPCHPFAEHCFTEGGLVDGLRWSFDAGDLEGAEARRRRVATRRSFLAEPLPGARRDVIDLDDLHAFFDDPTGAFFEQRLGIRLPRPSDRLETVLPVHLDALSNWQVGDRFLRARLEGRTVEEWSEHERRLGTLPPGILGERVVERIARQVEDLVRSAADLGVAGGRPSPEVVDVRLADGTRVVGTVPLALAAGGPGPALVTFSREKPSHQVRAWLDLVILGLARPDVHWRFVVVCRRTSGRTEGPACFDYVLAPPDKDRPTPEECLALAVALYRTGMDEPIPLFPKLSYKLTRDPNANMATTWRSSPGGFSPPGEGESPAAELVYGRCDVGAVLRLPARPGDPGHGSESSRARRLGRALYCSVLAATRNQAPAVEKGGSKRAGKPARR